MMVRQSRHVYLDQLPWKARKDLERELYPPEIWKEVAGSYELDATRVREIEIHANNKQTSHSSLLIEQLTFRNVTISELCVKLIRLGFMPAASIIVNYSDEAVGRLFQDAENGENPEFMQVGVDFEPPNMPPSPKNQHFPPESISVPPSYTSSMASSINDVTNGYIRNEYESVVPSKSASTCSLNSAGSCAADKRPFVALPPEDCPSQSPMNSSRHVQHIQHILPFVPYKRIQQATEEFKQDYLIGRGYFSEVFKAEIDGTAYAIKILDLKKLRRDGFDHRDLINRELCTLSYQHKCIMPLRGYSFGTYYCFLYDYMENGSLRDALDKKNLTFQQRVRITEQVASGLRYLHSKDPPVVHGDMKSANVLLDHHFEAKISDFNLSQWLAAPLLSATDSLLLRSSSTEGYLPIECFYMDSALTPNVDVFSFGVILLEILTGLKAVDRSRGASRALLFQHVFSEPTSQCFTQLADSTASWPQVVFLDILVIAADCLNQKCPQQRPPMEKVVDKLRQLIQKVESNP